MAQSKVHRGRSDKPRCEDCYFRRNMLCSLDLDQPCSTFRPNRPEGLVPPRQPVLLMRAPRWAGTDPSQPRAPRAEPQTSTWAQPRTEPRTEPRSTPRAEPLRRGFGAELALHG